MRSKCLENWIETALPEPVRALKRSRLGVQISVFSSAKNQRSWNLESSIELDFAHSLEWSKDVLRFVPQPMQIRYLQRGIWKIYVPDFMHLTSKMAKVVTEIKPVGWDESPFLVEKYEICKTELKHQGIEFQVLTDLDIRRGELHRNLRYLYPYYRMTTPAEILEVVAALSRMSETRATVDQLLALPDPPTYKACAAFAYQCWDHIYSQPFGMSAVLELEG